VKKGQQIAKIDPQLFEAAVEQAKANFVAGKANLSKAKVQATDSRRQYTRSKALFERKLIAQQDLDTSQATADAADAAVEAAEAALEQAKANLHSAQVNLAYTDIISPTDGTVISRNVDVGQTVAASLQAPTLFTIAEDLRKMQVDTNVAEADVGKLKPGTTAKFTVDAYPTEQFNGVIRQIRNAPQTLQNVVTYDAVIDVDNSELELKPGMTANVTVQYAEKDDVLKVPNAALRFRPPPGFLKQKGDPDPSAPGVANAASSENKRSERPQADAPRTDRRTVYRLTNGHPEAVKVRIGLTDGIATELVEGDLRADDAVITEVLGEKGASAPGAPNPNAFRRPF
jgi:HlyD family secretion protein